MKLRLMSFNHFLFAVLAVVLLAGCASSSESKKKKEAATLRLYLESTSDNTENSTAVPVYRDAPVVVRVEKIPFVDEGDIANAALVDVVGGFAIQITYNFHGRLALEQVTAAKKGWRIAIHCQATEGRWLAAPVISQKISDGVFTFTPDATREEAERIVRGLNNVAVTLKNKPKP